MPIEKIKIDSAVRNKVLRTPSSRMCSTPEEAIVAKGMLLGIPLERISGGWVEYDANTKLWKVHQVCQRNT